MRIPRTTTAKLGYANSCRYARQNCQSLGLRHCSNDARQMKRQSKKVRPVRQYRCERDLNLGIVDFLHKPTEQIAKAAPKAAPPATSTTKSRTPANIPKRELATAPNENSVQYDGCAIVKQTLPFNNDGEPFVNGHVFEN